MRARALGLASLLLAAEVLLGPSASAAARSPRPPSAPSASTTKARAAATKVLGAPHVAFCHQESYQLDRQAHAWCDVTAGSAGSQGGTSPGLVPCPAWKAICARPPGTVTRFLHHTARASESFKGLPDVSWPFRILLGALLLGLIVALARLGKTAPRPKLAAEAQRDESPGDDAVVQARRRLVETDVQRLLARAAAAAAAGDFASACGDTYAALLRRLEGAGLWRVEPHLTNGDMVRAVTRPKPELAPELRAVVRDIELVQFGREPITRATFDGLWERVQRLLRHQLFLWLIGATSLLALGSCQGGEDGQRWNESPNGHAAWVPFLTAYGLEARERVAPLGRLAEAPKAGTATRDPDSLVLLPTAAVDEAEWKAIEAWLERAPHLLVVAGPSSERVAWKKLAGLELSRETGGVADAAGLVAGERRLLHLPATRTIGGTVGTVAFSYIKTKEVYGRRVFVPLPRPAEGADEDEEHEEALPSEILVLADDALLTNASLLFPDNAAAIAEALRQAGPRVELVTDVSSLVADSPTEVVERSGLGPAFVQLALLLLLAFVARGAIFGTPRDPAEASRRDFVEHVRAVGALAERSGHAQRALQVFAAFVVERLRARHGLAGGRSLSSLAEVVAARTGQPLGHVMSLLVEAKGSGTPDNEALARLRELASLLQEKGDSIERR